MGMMHRTTSTLRRAPVILKWAPAYVLAFIVVFLLAQCVVFVTHDEGGYHPIDLLDISVSPDPVVIGQPATLTNGLCLRQKDPLTVQVYLGLQANSGPINLVNPGIIDLAGRNVAGERQPLVLDGEGCHHETTEVKAVPSPPVLPGEWVVIMTVVATGPNGEVQQITHRSAPFTVIVPP